MADVQLEHGYTRIANELLEALARVPLPGPRHFQVMLAMIRLLYGYQRAEGRLSSTQVAELTGLDPGNVRHVLADLVELGLLECLEAGSGRPALWRVQKDHEHWAAERLAKGASSTTRVAHDAATRVVHDAATCVAHDATLKERKKEKKQESAPRTDRLLLLLKDYAGSPEEKALWLAHELPLIREKAKRSRETVEVLVHRFYRQYVKLDVREHRTKLAQRARETARTREREQERREEAALTPEQLEANQRTAKALWEQFHESKRAPPLRASG